MRGESIHKSISYVPIAGWFDLTKLALPKDKFRAYAKLQQLGTYYQKTYAYQKQFNTAQLERVKEMCAEMSMDLILNYNALEILNGKSQMNKK